MRLAMTGSLLAIATALTALVAAAPDRSPGDADPAASVKVQLRGVNEKIAVVERPDGSHAFELTHDDGHIERLDPNAFATRVYNEQASRHWFMRVLNITSWLGAIWVAVGLSGQVLFTGRMVVQWVVSERFKQSVVPTAFWWMSLCGASMLVIYFVWRKDIVGVLGQCTGWTIYVRNLWLIYAGRRRLPTAAEDPGPEPELSNRRGADDPAST